MAFAASAGRLVSESCHDILWFSPGKFLFHGLLFSDSLAVFIFERLFSVPVCPEAAGSGKASLFSGKGEDSPAAVDRTAQPFALSAASAGDFCTASAAAGTILQIEIMGF